MLSSIFLHKLVLKHRKKNSMEFITVSLEKKDFREYWGQAYHLTINNDEELLLIVYTVPTTV